MIFANLVRKLNLKVYYVNQHDSVLDIQTPSQSRLPLTIFVFLMSFTSTYRRRSHTKCFKTKVGH